jgi:hypothetical protein
MPDNAINGFAVVKTVAIVGRTEEFLHTECLKDVVATA